MSGFDGFKKTGLDEDIEENLIKHIIDQKDMESKRV